MRAIADINANAVESVGMIRRWQDFSASRVAVAALGLIVLLVMLAVFARWIAPQNPYDLSQLSIMDNKLPPGSHGLAGELYALGTDDQGRDMLSAIIYGLRLSLFVAIVATVI